MGLPSGLYPPGMLHAPLGQPSKTISLQKEHIGTSQRPPHAVHSHLDGEAALRACHVCCSVSSSAGEEQRESKESEGFGQCEGDARQWDQFPVKPAVKSERLCSNVMYERTVTLL